MISPDYKPKAECIHVEQARKHHCHVPADVWDMTPETVCAVCMLKNHHLFVAAAVAIVEIAKQKVTPFRKPRLCECCSYIQLDRTYWEAGERICSECRWRSSAEKKGESNGRTN